MLALGFSSSAINSVLHSAAMAASTSSVEAYDVEGSGGMIVAECFKAAGIKYIFDCNSTGQNPFYDALSVRSELNLIVAVHEG